MVLSAGVVYNLILHHFIHIPLIDGEVEPSLGEYRSAHDIDMLIMGAYGHSVIRRFLVGSTTTSVIRNSSIPVLLLR